MYSIKFFYKLSLFVGLLFFIIGLIMKIFEATSSGLVFSKKDISTGILDGNGTIFIAFIILILSAMAYFKNKKEIERRKNSSKEEAVIIWKSIRKKNRKTKN